jgi:hypothetical protein
VKNTKDFCEQLSKKTPPSSKYMLVSFDVENLFTNVPALEAVNVAKKYLENTGAEATIISGFVSLLKVCIDQNYFKFNGEYYQQLDGLAMGSPLSPLLAELFMDYFEEKLFSDNSVNTKNIYCWFRYVDDVFAIWTGTDRQLDNFLTTLNTQCKGIQFTCEKEKEGKLNFLDVTVSKTEKKFGYSIFRKTTATDHIIPSDSRHHISHKLSTFHFLLNRLLDIPLSKNAFDQELEIIKAIAVSNGYKVSMIEKMLRKKYRTRAHHLLYAPAKTGEKNSRWCKLTYYGIISEEIGSLFPKEKFRIAFSNNNNLRKFLNNTKDKVQPLENSGIYKLQCNECSATYIGQSGRSIRTRVEEHERCFRKCNISQSHFAKHLWEENHTSNFLPEILHRARKGKRMDKTEELEIRKHMKTSKLLNDILFDNHSPLLEASLSLTERQKQRTFPPPPADNPPPP